MFNNLVIQGRLVADPEVNKTKSGKTVTSFRIANTKYLGKDRDDRVRFIGCKAWKGIGDVVANHFKKGDPISLQGELDVEEYKNKDGQNRSVPYILVDKVVFAPYAKAKSA